VRRLAALTLAAGLALCACGEAPRSANEPRVRLKLDVPDDGGQVRADRVEVRGTVTPGDAAVQVAGTDAEVDAGQFTASVALQPGGNVIDITATAPGRRPAADAVRVMRDMRVKVPPLVGLEAGAAAAQLKQRGLQASVVDHDSWLERVLGGEVDVCSMQPGAGALVDPRATITLQTSRSC
jgi:Glucodextranase, domain B/PASTA domain